jgi:hypothetical protein
VHPEDVAALAPRYSLIVSVTLVAARGRKDWNHDSSLGCLLSVLRRPILLTSRPQTTAEVRPRGTRVTNVSARAAPGVWAKG